MLPSKTPTMTCTYVCTKTGQSRRRNVTTDQKPFHPDHVALCLFTETAVRRCSENGFWLDENGQEAADPSWTNFIGCFRPEITKVMEGFYANISGM